MVNFKLGKEIKKDVFSLVTSLGQRKNSESPWAIKPQNFGFCSLMLYHWATECEWGLLWRGLSWSSFLDSLWGLSIVSLSHAPDETKTSFSSSMEILKGQLFAALHRFENSLNIGAAIQIFLYLPMSRFDSHSLYNICNVRRRSYVSRVFSYLHLITW